MAIKPEERKRKKGASADIRKEVSAMKPTFTMDIHLGKFLGADAKDAGKRAEAAQGIAGKVRDAASASVSPLVPVCSVGASGRVWSMSSPSGIIKVSYQNEEGQPVRIEFFRFDQNSALVTEIRGSLQPYL